MSEIHMKPLIISIEKLTISKIYYKEIEFYVYNVQTLFLLNIAQNFEPRIQPQ